MHRAARPTLQQLRGLPCRRPNQGMLLYSQTPIEIYICIYVYIDIDIEIDIDIDICIEPHVQLSNSFEAFLAAALIKACLYIYI